MKINIDLWKRVYTISCERGSDGLKLRDKMEHVEQRLHETEPENVDLIEFTDGGLYFAGFIAHVSGGTQEEVERWLTNTIKEFS